LGGIGVGDEHAAEAQVKVVAQRGRRALRPARLLMVEDDFLVAADMQDRLTEAGFVVVGVANSAAEAIELAARAQPEIAIMDIRILGPRDGVDTAIELRMRFDIPSVFATAHVDHITMARAEPARPLGWVGKPYSITTLVDLLNRVLAA
jgi:DNA-binding NarL/FixJ family response regulator